MLDRSAKRGSALVMALVTALVLSILVGALFLLFQSNVASYEWTLEEMQAMYTAEAGANLATYMILQGVDVPLDSCHQFLPETGTGWVDLPGDDLGEVKVWVDPHQDNEEICSANAYVVKARGRINTDAGSYEYGMETMLMPENFSRFSCFQDEGFTSYVYNDDYRFDGPFHTNGTIRLYSESAGFGDDVYFYSLSIADKDVGQDGYIYHNGGIYTTEPQIGQLRIEPYQRMVLGPPYFDMHADSIPYGPTEVDWESARDAAISGGVYYGSPADSTRVLLSHDTVWVRESNMTPADIHVMSDYTNPVVWFDNGNTERIFIKQFPSTAADSLNGVDIPLTIGMNGHLVIAGHHRYDNEDVIDPDNDDMLGLITVHGDVLIGTDPQDLSIPDWAPPFTMKCESDINFDAIFMALDGEFRADDHHFPPSHAYLNILGGYIAVREGLTEDGSGGHSIVIYYDSRLMTTNPPFFPNTGKWQVVFWRDRKDDLDMMEEDEY